MGEMGRGGKRRKGRGGVRKEGETNFKAKI